MKRIVIATAMSLCLVFLSAAASADTLVLRDGTRIPGRIVAFAARTITFRGADGVSRRYPTGDVTAVEFLPPPNAHAVTARSLEAPAGTELDVRTGEAIDSRSVHADQTFAAVVEGDVTDVSGQVIIPRRSSAQLVIREVSSGGATGNPEMMLDVRSVTVDGRRYLISTKDLTVKSDQGLGQNRRTAETVGGGAALGTIIGAIAGGAKGAAIGAVAGTAGGAGVQVITKGRDVRVPADTVLRFRLDRAVVLHPER
jgi:hypothetical protein